jgi:hypothetical protein
VDSIGGQQPETVPFVGSSNNQERTAAPPSRIQGLVNQRPTYVFGRATTVSLLNTGWLGQTAATQTVALSRGQYIAQIFDATDPSAVASIRQGSNNAGVIAAAEMGSTVGAESDIGVGDVAEFTVTDESNNYLTAVSSSPTTTMRVRRIDSAER